jgi:hypothetical protein
MGFGSKVENYSTSRIQIYHSETLKEEEKKTSTAQIEASDFLEHIRESKPKGTFKEYKSGLASFWFCGKVMI